VALVAISALLVAAAALGAFAPAGPYNLFHLAAGTLGLGLFASGRPGAAARFNFGFGLIDLYQVVAGLFDLPPARLFALRPFDHVTHVVLGVALVAVAWPLLRGERACG
jgi:hypothetical protein